MRVDSFSSSDHDFVLRFFKLEREIMSEVDNFEVDVEIEEKKPSKKTTKKKAESKKSEETAVVQDGTKIEIKGDRTSYTYTFPNPAMTKQGGYYVPLSKVSVQRQTDQFQNEKGIVRATLRISGSESSVAVDEKYFNAFSNMVNKNYNTVGTAMNQIRSGNISGAAKTIGKKMAGGCSSCGKKK